MEIGLMERKLRGVVVVVVVVVVVIVVVVEDGVGFEVMVWDSYGGCSIY